VFAGQLSFGASNAHTGSVAAESGPFADAANWSFWKFAVPYMDEVQITVTPTDAALDAFITVWYGIESDTANYFGMGSDSVMTTYVDSADGLVPNGPAGRGAPAGLHIRNDYGNDFFTLAIADYTDGVGSGQLAFTISAVPEPGSYALMIAGLGLLAGAARMRRR